MGEQAPRQVGGLFTVSGPYGAGKDTLLNSIIDRFDNSSLHRVTTLTTRPSSADADPSYTTVTAQDFDMLTRNGEWVVNQQFSGAVSYATSLDEIRQQISAGKVCLHTIFAGPNGAGRIRQLMGRHMVAVGVLASNGDMDAQISVLRRRLHDRTRDDDAALSARLNHQLDPIRYVMQNKETATIDGPMPVFDAVIVNDDRDHAIADVRKVFEEAFPFVKEAE